MTPHRPSPVQAIIAMAFASAGLALAPQSAAHAQAALPNDLRMTVEQPHFTCEGNGMRFSHVAYRIGQPPISAPVLPCCDGRLACAQFLSTSTVLRPLRHWHS